MHHDGEQVKSISSASTIAVALPKWQDHHAACGGIVTRRCVGASDEVCSSGRSSVCVSQQGSVFAGQMSQMCNACMCVGQLVTYPSCLGMLSPIELNGVISEWRKSEIVDACELSKR